MPRIGEVLAERYRVEALLGAGGMASVYRAMDLRLAREVAVKVLAPNLAADPLFAARFDREARALAAVAHPNVVAIYDVEPGQPAAGQEPFYVMELCDGGTLGDRLEAEGPMRPAEVVPIVAAVAEGLAALHARGLVHRDVKPHNILFHDGRPKLGDFGLARGETVRDLSTLTAPGATVGTLPYLAPELLAGEPASPASDVYALAAMTFQALSGRLPKPSGSMREIVEHRADPPPSLSAVAPAVGRAYDEPIARALATDPGGRPDLPTFVAALERAAEGRIPNAMIPGLEAAPRSPAARPSDANTIVTSAALASGVASPNPDLRSDVDLRPGPPQLSGARPTIGGRPRSGARPPVPRARIEPRDRGYGRRLQVLAGLALAVIAIAILIALAGLLGRALPGSVPGELPGESTPAASTPAASASPTASATASPDPAAAALQALDQVRAAIQAAQGGRDGLSGRDVNELDSLANDVGSALARHDYAAARTATQTLASRADKLSKGIDPARRTALLDAISTLASAIPT